MTISMGPDVEPTADLVARLRAVAPTGKITPSQLRRLADLWAPNPDELAPHLLPPCRMPYGRKVLFRSESLEVLVVNWAALAACSPHDHGRATFGFVRVVRGQVLDTRFLPDRRGRPAEAGSNEYAAPAVAFVPAGVIHRMSNPADGPLVTLHFYAPPITRMKVFDPGNARAWVVSDDCGAWTPDPAQVLQMIRLGRVLPAPPARLKEGAD